MESIKMIKAELLPDYDVNEDSLSFDYTLNATMYPISSLRASTLTSVGLKVYEIVKCADKVKTYRAGKKHKFSSVNQYAVKKTDWQEFIKSEVGRNFISLWEQTANYAQRILCREPVMQKNELYSCYEEIYWEETAKCREYLKETGSVKESDSVEDEDSGYKLFYGYCFQDTYGRALANEYARKLENVNISLGRKKIDMLCGYIEIVKMQYDCLLDEFYKATQEKEETK